MKLNYNNKKMKMEVSPCENKSNGNDNTTINNINNNNYNNNNNNNNKNKNYINNLDPKVLEIIKKRRKNIRCSRYQYKHDIFYIPNRYRPGETIGSGSYGSVINAEDTQNNHQLVAIKKLKGITDIYDLKRILREIIIMKYCEHENIIPLYDVIIHLNEGDSQTKKLADVYLVMEKMDSDLQKIILSKQELSDEHYQFILYQILRALFYLHSANIIHRDFKPSNVLINEDCTVKLCDFGMSRGLKDEDMQLTEYVVTRYYRAPEVMLSSHHYSKKIDVWSVGCTFAELLKKSFLFPGDNYINQVKMIIEVLGGQKDEDLNFISNSSAKSFVTQFKDTPKKDFKEILCYDENPEAVDLIEKMLAFNPEKRFSIEDCLNHNYLKNIREGIDDPVFTGKINLEWDYDKNVSMNQLFGLLVTECSEYPSGVV